MNHLYNGRRLRAALAGLCSTGAMAAMTLHAPAAYAEADVLQRPALHSARAATSSMLAIALAGRRIVAVGERGIIVYSDDGGAHWRQAVVPVSVSLAGVRFLNGQDGWAVGHSGVILRTVDGGQTWSRQLDGVRAAQLALEAAQAGLASRAPQAGQAAQATPAVSVAAVAPAAQTANGARASHAAQVSQAAQAAQAAQVGQVAQASDVAQAAQVGRNAQAGLTAAPAAETERVLADAQRLVADGPSKPFFAMTFFDAQHGQVAGAFGLLFATDDGGASWRPAFDRLGGGRDRHLYAIETAGGACYIAGEQGTVLRADPCGGAYHALATPYAGTWFGAIGGANGEAVLFGMRGNVYWSEQGGRQWKKSEIATPNSLTAGLRLQDGALLLADETGQLFVSRDDGKSFRRVPGIPATPVTGMVQAQDGSVFLSGLRGVTKIELSSLKAASS